MTAVAYRGCHKVVSFYSRGAKQLTCGFSIALLGSSSTESDPVIARFRDFERPEHAPRSPAGTQTCTVVYRRFPCVPADESARKDARAPEKSLQMSPQNR